MISEIDMIRQRREAIALDREYTEKYLRWKSEKPGMFTSWWKLGIFLLWTGGMFGAIYLSAMAIWKAMR
jgi:hypothetical protein